jgi:hypothetical protein
MSDGDSDTGTSNPVRMALWVLTLAAIGLLLGTIPAVIAGDSERDRRMGDRKHPWFDALPLLGAAAASPCGVFVELYCQRRDRKKPP